MGVKVGVVCFFVFVSVIQFVECRHLQENVDKDSLTVFRTPETDENALKPLPPNFASKYKILQKSSLKDKIASRSFLNFFPFARFHPEETEDDEEESDAPLNLNFAPDEEDPHFYQERYKKEEEDEEPEIIVHDPRDSIANSYFDNEYSLTMLQRMECSTPTKSKGYCSTFRSCVPSLFTSDGELEAPALAELVSMSIGYCTNAANNGDNYLFKRTGQRYYSVANRIICCPGTPPPPGTSADETSAEKINDFLSDPFNEGDEEENVSPLKANESKDKAKNSSTTPRPQVSEDLKGEFVELSEDNESEVWHSEEDIKIKGDKNSRPQNVIPIEALIPKEQLANYDPNTKTFRLPLKPQQDEENGDPSDKKNDHLGINIPEGKLPHIDENVKNVQNDKTAEIVDNAPTNVQNENNQQTEEKESFNIQQLQNDKIPIENVHVFDNGPLSDEFVADSESSEVPSATPAVDEGISFNKNVIIELSPKPVSGANGKFALEKGVLVEKATAVTPRPAPNPWNQIQLGETTVNIIKSEVVDSNSILLIPVNSKSKLNNKYSAKIPQKDEEIETTTSKNFEDYSTTTRYWENSNSNGNQNDEVEQKTTFIPAGNFEISETTTLKNLGDGITEMFLNDGQLDNTAENEKEGVYPVEVTTIGQTLPSEDATAKTEAVQHFENNFENTPENLQTQDDVQIKTETFQSPENEVNFQNIRNSLKNQEQPIVVNQIQTVKNDVTFPNTANKRPENGRPQNQLDSSYQTFNNPNPNLLQLFPTGAASVSPQNSVISQTSVSPSPTNSKGEEAMLGGLNPEGSEDFQILSSCAATADFYRSGIEVGTDGSQNYPYLATIVGGSRPFCSGTLITDRHILTAAHFLSNITVADVLHMRVHVGYRSNSRSLTPTEGPFAVRKVLKVIRHKGFSFDKLINDMAILLLERPIPFSSQLHPICLSNAENNVFLNPYSGEKEAEAFETGWVEDPLMKKPSPHHPFVDPHLLKYFSFGYSNVTWSLQQSITRLKSREECQSSYEFLEKSGIRIEDSMICGATGDGKSCAFKGNSGAPLITLKNGRPTQIGLSSWGIGCGHFPAVFTGVSSYLPWIEKVIERTR